MINAIWQRLLQRNIEIEPVAQQMVRRFDGHGHKFALIDLFFPAVNIGIEVDEEGHLKSEHVDKIREEAVLHVLYEENGFDSTKLKPEAQILAPDLDETAVPELLRIKTYLGYGAVEQQINEAVDEICRRAALLREKNPEALKWVTPEEKQAEIAKRGWITIEDRAFFRTIPEIFECISPANTNEEGELIRPEPLKVLRNLQCFGVRCLVFKMRTDPLLRFQIPVG